MSVRFDNVGDGLTQANNVAGNSNWTAMCWVRINTPIDELDFTGYQTIFRRASADDLQYIHYFFDSTDFVLDESNGVDTGGASNQDHETARWYHVTMVKSAATMLLKYINFKAFYDLNYDIDANVYSTIKLGYDGIAGQPGLQVAYFREWDAALDEGEITLEVMSASAVRVLNLITDTPLASDYLDDSGNGNDWTPVGAPTFSGQPTFPTPPANWTEATALVIPSLPYEADQLDVCSEGFTFGVWFKYIPTVNDVVMSAKFLGVSAANYRPILLSFLDDSSQLLWETSPSRQFSVPMLAGRPLLFYAAEDNHTATDAYLQISLLHCQLDDDIVRGSFFIRGGGIPSWWITYGYTGIYAGFINPETEEIYHYFSIFPPGESGDVLPSNGRMLFADDFEVLGIFGEFTLYDSDFNVVTNFNWPWTPAVYPFWPYIRASRETNKFYVFNYGDLADGAKYMTVGADGIVSADTYFPGVPVFSGVIAGANSHDDLYIYLATISGDVKKYEKSSGTFLTDLAGIVDTGSPDFLTCRSYDMLVMPGGEIVVIYQPFAGSTFNIKIFVKIYSPDGTVLNTYTAPSSPWYTATQARLAYADDLTSFWLFLHYNGATPYNGKSRFINIQVSDLAVLQDFMTPDGYIDSQPFSTMAAAADFRFSTSDSCPLVLMLPPPPERGGIYTNPPTTTTPPLPPGPRRDTYIGGDVKIPDPTIRTALFGE